MFEIFWNKRRKAHPDEPKYITLCYILEGSGEDRKTIETIFESYLDELIDYDNEEKIQMVNYLFTISKDTE